MSEQVKEDGAPGVIEEAQEIPTTTEDELIAVWEQVTGEPIEAKEEETTEEVVEETPPEPTEEVQEVIEEVVEEPEIPLLTHVDKEKYGEVDLTSELEVDAINFWAKGPKADWTRKPNDEKTEEELAVFKKYQSAHDSMNAKPKEEPVANGMSKEDYEATMADLIRITRGDTETMQKYGLAETTKAEPEAPKPVSINDKVKKLGEAFELDDKEAFTNGLMELVSAVNDNAESKVLEAQKLAEQSFDSKQEQRTKQEQLDKVTEDARRLAQSEGSAFTQYIENGAMERYLDLGFDPLTGARIGSVSEAYSLCQKYDNGTTPVVRQSSSIQAVSPPGSGVGNESTITESDLELPWDEYMEKVNHKIFSQGR